MAGARVAVAEALRLMGEDIDPSDIEDPRAVMAGLATRSHALLDRLQQMMRENPNAGQIHAYERAVDRTAALVEALDKMDQARAGKGVGPTVVVIDTRPPWERDADIIDMPAIEPGSPPVT